MALTLSKQQARQYSTSRQLIAGDDFNNLVAQLNSAESGITASTIQTQAGARQLACAVNTLSVVANANDAVKLPKGIPGLQVAVRNSGANAAKVFTFGVGTIEGTDGAAAGVALNNATTTLYTCFDVAASGAETWFSK